MAHAMLTRRSPSAEEIGKARLQGYRLQFSRRSKRTGTGVADVVVAPGFTVMGVLYNVPSDEWDALQLKEGLQMHPPAYRQVEVDVFSFVDKTVRRAVTFVVADPESVEQIPSPEYIGAMIEEVERRGLRPYGQFLRWLQSCSNTTQNKPLRNGLWVTGTSLRQKSHGHYIVRANPGAVIGSSKARLVSVEFNGRITTARLQSVPELPDRLCEMDQNLRHALGMIGQNSYGYTVVLRAQSSRNILPAVVAPRTLCLKIHQTNWTDSEKRICILHHRNIAMLGIKEGEQIEIECSTRDDSGAILTKRIRLRVYSAEQRDNQSRTYPAIDEIYLDRECRTELGLSIDRSTFVDWPVLVRPSVGHLLRRRIVIYGITFFLGTASLSQVLSLLMPNLPSAARAAVAIALAAVTTIAVTLIDIRANLRY
jgi:hypothetical protein